MIKQGLILIPINLRFRVWIKIQPYFCYCVPICDTVILCDLEQEKYILDVVWYRYCSLCDIIAWHCIVSDFKCDILDGFYGYNDIDIDIDIRIIK